MSTTRREFAGAALATVGIALCPCFAAEQLPKAKEEKPKPEQKSLIAITEICCGTCQYWMGEREIVEKGRRLRCDTVPKLPCYRGQGFKYAAKSSAASHGCVGKHYKPWVGLPIRAEPKS